MDRADRQKLLLVLLLAIIVGYVGYYGVGAFKGVSGFQAEAAKLRQDRDELQQQVESATILVANLDRIRKEREALEIQLRELSRRLPSEHESVQVLRSVETLAGKSGLTVNKVLRRPGKPQELYVEIPMEVLVGGSYGDLLKFADQLSQLPRLVTLNEFRVTARGARVPGETPNPVADAAPGTVNARLVAVVFQALPAAAAGAAPAAPRP